MGDSFFRSILHTATYGRYQVVKSYQLTVYGSQWKANNKETCLYIDLEERIIENRPLKLVEEMFNRRERRRELQKNGKDENESESGSENENENERGNNIKKDQDQGYPELDEQKIRIICLSDTHTLHNSIVVPDGDVLVYCGDMGFSDWGSNLSVLNDFNKFLEKLPHRQKFLVAGNHDGSCAQNTQPLVQDKLSNCVYLCNNQTYSELDHLSPHSPLSIYGSPVSPSGKSRNVAFQFKSNSAQFHQEWNPIPPNLDLLLTHSQPIGPLNSKIFETKPRVHIYGHVHSLYGAEFSNDTLQICASSIDRHYCPTHPPIILDMYPSQQQFITS